MVLQPTKPGTYQARMCSLVITPHGTYQARPVSMVGVAGAGHLPRQAVAEYDLACISPISRLYLPGQAVAEYDLAKIAAGDYPKIEAGPTEPEPEPEPQPQPEPSP